MFTHLSRALLLSIAVGCTRTDATAPQSSTTVGHIDHGVTFFEEGRQEAPEAVPESMRFPTFLHAVEADAGYVDGYAYAGSIVRYFATNAIARATVKTNVGENTGESETSDALPASRSHMASVSYDLGTCGEKIQGIAYGRVWNQFPYFGSFLTWGGKADTRTASADCTVKENGKSSPGEGSGGGSEPATVLTCYTLEIDYYEFDPYLGIIVYLGTERRSWCVYNGGDAT